MIRLYVLSFAICLFAACSQNEKAKDAGGKMVAEKSHYTEGKDYFLLKRFRITDDQGFNQPVEAVSFLLPANWKVKSNVQWNGASKCMPEILQVSMTATSPDGEFEIVMLPVTQFDWSNDELTLDAMRRGGFVYSCHLQQPLNAEEYLSNELAPLVNAAVVQTKRPEQLEAAMQQGAAQMKQAAMQAGNNAYDYKASAAEATLHFNDGKQGIALCSITETIVTTPGAFSNTIQTFQCYVSSRMVIKFPKEKEAEARNMLGTMISSARGNPEWVAAVQKTFGAIQKGAQQTLGQIIEITTKAQNEISNNITRSWESSASTDANNKAFGEYIRGVDSWADEGGNKVELTAGYSNAWQKGDGSYILTNDVSLDPNIIFNESWTRMKK